MSYGKTKGLKLWQVLVGAGALVGGLVLFSRSAQAKGAPADPAKLLSAACSVSRTITDAQKQGWDWSSLDATGAIIRVLDLAGVRPIGSWPPISRDAPQSDVDNWLAAKDALTSVLWECRSP